MHSPSPSSSSPAPRKLTAANANTNTSSPSPLSPSSPPTISPSGRLLQSSKHTHTSRASLRPLRALLLLTFIVVAAMVVWFLINTFRAVEILDKQQQERSVPIDNTLPPSTADNGDGWQPLPLQQQKEQRLDPHSHASLHRTHERMKNANREAIARHAKEHPQQATAEDMDPQTEHIFLQSPARPRQHVTADSLPARADVDNARLPSAYLLHLKPPLTERSVSALKQLLRSQQVQYHIAKYVPLGNFIVVPNRAAAAATDEGTNEDEAADVAAARSDSNALAEERKLLQLLESPANTLVRKWHRYESRDKIDRDLYDNCASPAPLLASFESQHAASIFTLTVALFHSASIESWRMEGVSDEARMREESRQHALAMHGHIPASTNAIVDDWKRQLKDIDIAAGNNTQYRLADVVLQPVGAHVVHVQVPLTFLQWSAVNTADAGASSPLCRLVDALASHPFVEYVAIDSAFETHNDHATQLIQTGRFESFFLANAASKQADAALIPNPFASFNAHAVNPSLQPSSTPFYALGLRGAGQVVTVADTGVAYKHCLFSSAPNLSSTSTHNDAFPLDSVDLTQRKIVSYVSYRGKEYDLKNGHGSHTAASIAGSVDPALLSRAEDRVREAQLRLNAAIAGHASSFVINSLQSKLSRLSAHLESLQTIARYHGVAPDAKLSVWDVNDGATAGKIKPPKNIFSDYYSLAYNMHGARVSSNSWGARNGSYIWESMETDRFAHTFPEFLPIFSAGNYGQKGAMSVVAPGTSKNSLCVGASGNVYIKTDAPRDFFCYSTVADGYSSSSAVASAQPQSPSYSSNPFLMESVPLRRLLSSISGQGLTYDGRIKPEILAPGHFVVSARSSGDRDGDDAVNRAFAAEGDEGYEIEGGCASCDGALMSLFGTSMSAAIAAGSAAIVRQYFSDGFHPLGYRFAANAFSPSGALVKAIMIHSAIPDIIEAGPPSGMGDSDEDVWSPPSTSYEMDASGAAVSRSSSSIVSSKAVPYLTGPSPRSGYGRLELASALPLRSAVDGKSIAPLREGMQLWVKDQVSMPALGFHGYCFRVSSASQMHPFRATLAWHDPPASLSASWLLVNDLDLSVSHLRSGITLVGNQHTDDPLPEYDRVNNVEQVTLPVFLTAAAADSSDSSSQQQSQLRAGDLISVHVRGSNIAVSPQRYSLVVTGSMDSVPTEECAGSAVCPLNCSARGRCSSAGVCECAAGFGGAGCEIATETIAACTPIEGTVKLGKWRYYRLDLPQMIVSTSSALPSSPFTPLSLAAVSVRVLLRGTSGSPDLYVAQGRLPQLQDHDASHLLGGTMQADGSALVSQVDLNVSPTAGSVVIGVYGYCCDEESSFQLLASACLPQQQADQQCCHSVS